MINPILSRPGQDAIMNATYGSPVAKEAEMEGRGAMTKKSSLERRIARAISKNYVVTDIAVGIYPERGYTDVWAAARDVMEILRKAGMLPREDGE